MRSTHLLVAAPERVTFRNNAAAGGRRRLDPREIPMNTTDQMMSMMSADTMGMSMDMKLMQDCMEACAAAEQAATMCADAGSGDNMGKMMSMCATTADMANTMMRMMMRPMGFDAGSMMAMLEATMTMCRACADECMMHADMSDHCRMCAEVCMNCAMACEALMGSMKA
jgi:hypothetical protein